MAISYKKLWKLLIDNQMKKKDLYKVADISGYSATKLNKNEPVPLEVLIRICKVFRCDIGEVMELIWDCEH